MKNILNRMWIRLSIAFTVVLLLVTILPDLAVLLLLKDKIVDFEAAIESFMDEHIPDDAIFEKEVPVYSTIYSTIEDRIILGESEIIFSLGESLFISAIISVFLGLCAGILLSRSVSKPAQKLAKAVKAIGQHDLSYRVSSSGSQELIDLAKAINSMADNLENTDKIRKNLMSDIAHELRTPLTVLQGNLQAMLDHIYKVNEEEVVLLYNQVDHLIRLVNALRDLSLPELGQPGLNPQMLDIVPVTKELINLHKPIAQDKGVTLILKHPQKTLNVMMNKDHYKQLLNNLIANGIRHTSAGGTVSVEMKKSEQGITIAISDNGEGLSPAVLPHLFDRFYRVDNKNSRDRGGTGLGLAIVKSIVHSYQGRVEVSSEGIGKGCVFTLYLPESKPQKMIDI